jgi:hypothetical protein
MSYKYGKPYKNKGKRRDPRYHNEEEPKDWGSNQENNEKLKTFDLRKALENPDSLFENFLEEPKKKSKIIKESRLDTGSRTSYTDEETEAGVQDDRGPSFEETLSNAIMDGWEDTLTTVIKEHLPDEEMKLLDDRDVWVHLGSFDEEMLELAMKIRDELLREEDGDYEFSRGFEESNRSSNRAEIDE